MKEFFIKDNENKFKNIIEVSGSHIYISQSFDFPYGVYLENDDIAETLISMMELIIKNNG